MGRPPHRRRRGRVWDDRYHARALTTPREVHNALAYVLLNFRRHGHTAGDIDPCSSAPWFRGWRTPSAAERSGPPPVLAARTWLARIGWRCHGLIARGWAAEGHLNPGGTAASTITLFLHAYEPRRGRHRVAVFDTTSALSSSRSWRPPR